VLAALERLSMRRSLGGRTGIALVAFALIGIVTLQLGLLKLNAGIGRALEHEALLQRENAALSIEDSELAAGERVTSEAVKLGMQAVPTGALRFLRVRPRIDPARSRAALSTPVHSSATGSAESPAGGSPAVPSSSSPSSSSTSPEPSTSESTTSSSPSSPSAPSPTTPASGERSEGGAGEPARAPGESSGPSTTATAPAGGGSTEGTPAGGTRAASSG
jgi:cell division protein FtsL